MIVLAFLTDPPVVKAIIEHLRLPCADPPRTIMKIEYWHPFISVSEAEDCLSALMNLSCDDWGTDPWECRSEALCDPE